MRGCSTTYFYYFIFYPFDVPLYYHFNQPGSKLLFSRLLLRLLTNDQFVTLPFYVLDMFN